MRGTNMGPSAIQVAGLIQRLVQEGHDFESVRSCGSESFNAREPGASNARFLPEISNICEELHERVYNGCHVGALPLVIGGDHSQAIGAISGLARYHHELSNEDIGVIWVDAHTDMNTPSSSPSGNIHGMPLATLFGRGPDRLLEVVGNKGLLNPKKVVIMGARDVDSSEIPLVKELGVRVYPMHEIDSRGMATCVNEALERVLDATAGVHLSFDLDGVDPEYAPGVGTPVPGGLSLRESHLLCESVSSTKKLLGMELVELNPTLDVRNKTGELAVWLIQSALGKRILG